MQHLEIPYFSIFYGNNRVRDRVLRALALHQLLTVKIFTAALFFTNPTKIQHLFFVFEISTFSASVSLLESNSYFFGTTLAIVDVVKLLN